VPVDPEQIYEEVLKEEQGKGVSPPVAEGRAKAARARAEAGSPHPKDPKWWPGAQPHLEGGEGGEAAEAEAEVEGEEAAPEPVAEEEPAAPAEEEQAARPAAEEAPAEAPAPAEPAPASTPEPAAAPASEPAPAAAPAAAAPAAAAPAAVAEPARPSGVTHGTKTGTRLRPEDEVTTDAQFEGQEAMYERRKLIDELVATGVPAVAADETGRPRTPWLAVLYLLIPIAVIAFLAGQESSESEAAPPAAEQPADDGGGGGAPALVASGTEWDTDTLTIPAKGAQVEITNEDPVVHNMSIYPDEQTATAKQDALFTGPDVDGGASETYEVDPIDPGTYTFICDYHTNMIGEVTVE
jgi:plastocyanin